MLSKYNISIRELDIKRDSYINLFLHTPFDIQWDTPAILSHTKYDSPYHIPALDVAYYLLFPSSQICVWLSGIPVS